MSINLPAPAIELQNIHLAWGSDIFFENINLTISAGKCTCFLGASGIGKSTLLKLIAGLIPSGTPKEIFRGNIVCDNRISAAQQIAWMSQTDLLQPWNTAFENVLLGYRLRGAVPDSIIQQAKKLFSQTGLNGSEKKYPWQLSGGMRQRVALIRTLLEDKLIVLMDEPFSAVDTLTRFKLQTLSADLLKNRTVVLVTHDPLEALRLADEIYILSGKPAELKKIIQLNTPTPREINNPELLKYQSILFDTLLQKNEVML